MNRQTDTNKKIETTEKERKQIANVLAGNIKSISIPFDLSVGEEAYYQFPTVRMADHENAISYSKGTIKQKGIIKRSIVGDFLFGRTGALIGGLTGSKVTESTSINATRNEQIDKGTMIVTNRRLYFVGSQVVSIPLSEIVSVHFPHYAAMEIQSPKKIKGEKYTISDREAIAYYKGVMRKVGIDKSAIKESDINNFMLKDRIIVPLNEDNSINCPSCGQTIKEYKKRWGLFSKTREYTCLHCGHIVYK